MSVEKFCPKCRSNKVPVRGDPDWCLTIFLLILGIVPGIIYLAIFFANPANRCIICNSELVPLPPQPQTLPNVGSSVMIPLADPVATNIATAVSLPVTTPPPSANSPKFCPYCGHERVAGAAFCPNCGSAF